MKLLTLAAVVLGIAVAFTIGDAVVSCIRRFWT